jgi:NAD(P)-dependent dehydrogenase (short-subunit alcohol dehydrogenase family)
VKRIEKLGTDAVAIQCDVSQESEVTRMIDKTIKRFGKIDVLINNASMVIDTPLLERTTEQRKRTMDVNLLGTFLCSKYVAKHMLKSKK